MNSCRQFLLKFQILFILAVLLNIEALAQFKEDNRILPYLLKNNKINQNYNWNESLNLMNNAPASALSTSINPDPPDLTLFSGIGKNFLNNFKGDNLYLHLAGVASTLLIVYSNTDYYVHDYFNKHENFGEYARPVIRMGTLFPILVGSSLYLYGVFGKDKETVGASFAVFQSSILTLLYNSLLKAITGRPHPDWRHNDNMKDLSKTFRFGFLRGGVFWGWPSGHTASTMAVVSALTNFYPDKTWLKIAGYSYVAYMMFAVSSLGRGGMHWLSDAVAAAFIAYAIGSTVGKFYRDKFKNTVQNSTNINPLSNPVGFSISFPL